jgi:arsenate reductase
VQYLKTTPEKADLKKILAKLDVPVDAIIRKEEKIYKGRFKGKNFTDDEWLTILHENPKLIQRPIVLRSNRGVIGRPTENVNELLK